MLCFKKEEMFENIFLGEDSGLKKINGIGVSTSTVLLSILRPGLSIGSIAIYMEISSVWWQGLNSKIINGHFPYFPLE